MDRERAHRYLVAEQCEDAERAGIGDLDATGNKPSVREPGRDERLPIRLDPALFEQLLRLQHVADHLLARPHDDPGGIERPPALALQPLLRLRGDLFVRLRPAPIGEFLRADRGRRRSLRACGGHAGKIAEQQTARGLDDGAKKLSALGGRFSRHDARAVVRCRVVHCTSSSRLGSLPFRLLLREPDQSARECLPRPARSLHIRCVPVIACQLRCTRSSRQVAAVHRDRLPGDIAEQVGCEQRDDLRDLCQQRQNGRAGSRRAPGDAAQA